MPAVCEKTFLCDSFIEEVVVMEDSKTTRDTIERVIKDDLKWPITTVETKKDVVSHVKKKVASFYILDNWVVDKNDGLDALEQIKKLDEKAFVAILTGHPSEIIKKQAEKLGANFYKTKTLNLERDIREIIDEKELLKKIREKYPDKPRFFEKVSEYEENIDLPSSYWFDTLELS